MPDKYIPVPKMRIAKVLLDYLTLYDIYDEELKKSWWGSAKSFVSSTWDSFLGVYNDYKFSFLPKIKTSKETISEIKRSLISELCLAENDNDLIEVLHNLLSYAKKAQSNKLTDSRSNLCENLFGLRAILLNYFETEAKEVLDAEKSKLRMKIAKLNEQRDKSLAALSFISVNQHSSYHHVTSASSDFSSIRRPDIVSLESEIKRHERSLGFLETKYEKIRLAFLNTDNFDFLLTTEEQKNKRQSSDDVLPPLLKDGYDEKLYTSNYQPIKGITITLKHYIEKSARNFEELHKDLKLFNEARAELEQQKREAEEKAKAEELARKKLEDQANKGKDSTELSNDAGRQPVNDSKKEIKENNGSEVNKKNVAPFKENFFKKEVATDKSNTISTSQNVHSVFLSSYQPIITDTLIQFEATRFLGNSKNHVYSNKNKTDKYIPVPKLEFCQILLDMLGLHEEVRSQDVEYGSWSIPIRKNLEGWLQVISKHPTSEQLIFKIKENLVFSFCLAKDYKDIIKILYDLCYYAEIAQHNRYKDADSKLCQNLFAIRSFILNRFIHDPIANEALVAEQNRLIERMKYYEDKRDKKLKSMDYLPSNDESKIKQLAYRQAYDSSGHPDLPKLEEKINKYKTKLMMLETNQDIIRDNFNNSKVFDFLLTAENRTIKEARMQGKEDDGKDIFPLQLSLDYQDTYYQEIQTLTKIEFEQFRKTSEINFAVGNYLLKKQNDSVQEQRELKAEEIRREEAARRERHLKVIKPEATNSAKIVEVLQNSGEAVKATTSSSATTAAATTSSNTNSNTNSNPSSTTTTSKAQTTYSDSATISQQQGILAKNTNQKTNNTTTVTQNTTTNQRPQQRS